MSILCLFQEGSVQTQAKSTNDIKTQKQSLHVELEAAVRSKETLSLELESLKTAFSLKDQRIAELVIFLFHFSLGF